VKIECFHPTIDACTEGNTCVSGEQAAQCLANVYVHVERTTAGVGIYIILDSVHYFIGCNGQRFSHDEWAIIHNIIGCRLRDLLWAENRQFLLLYECDLFIF
jgi:hypothetical protein